MVLIAGSVPTSASTTSPKMVLSAATTSPPTQTSSTSPTSTATSSGKGGGLSAGAWVGIGAGVLSGLGGIAKIIMMIMECRKRKQQSAAGKGFA